MFRQITGNRFCGKGGNRTLPLPVEVIAQWFDSALGRGIESKLVARFNQFARIKIL
jgi:hypothetical protein